MNLKELCQIRQIMPFKTTTPLIIPSFSSKGFVDIKDIHSNLSQHLIDASLVSSYDLHYGNLKIEDIYCSNIVFIDSGGYERRFDTELSEIYHQQYEPKEWN
jgi:hypothetical protein